MACDYSLKIFRENYLKWQKTKKRKYREKAFNEAILLVPVVLKRSFRRMSDFDEDDGKSVAYTLIWRKIGECKIPNKKCTQALFTMIYRAIINAIRQMAKGRLPPEGYEPKIGYCPTANDAEIKMMIEDIPTYLYNYVKTNNRFSGLSYRACLYIVKKIVNGEKFKVASYGSLTTLPRSHLKFLKSYVIVLCRKGLYDLYEETKDKLFLSEKLVGSLDAKDAFGVYNILAEESETD